MLSISERLCLSLPKRTHVDMELSEEASKSAMDGQSSPLAKLGQRALRTEEL